MYGQSPSNGQWGSQGGYSRSGLLDHQSPGNDWSSQDYESMSPTHNWSNRSDYDEPNSDSAWPSSGSQQPPYHQNRSDLDVNNGYSGETSRPSSNSWPKSLPNNRKRPFPVEEDDYPRSGPGFSRPRSGQWPRSDNRPGSDSRPNRPNWNESGERSDNWSLSSPLSKRPPWSKPGTSSSLGLGRGRARPSPTQNRFSDSPSTTNNWSKPNISKPSWSRSPLIDSFEQSDMPASKPWERFGRPFNQKGEGLRTRKQSHFDVQSVLDSMITTYYVNQEKVNMPKELTSKFEPLKCNLCGVIVNSTVTAKTHYSGKLHDKKVVQFMQKWCAEKGQPLPDQFKEGVSRKPNISQLDEMRALYCSVCEVPLTSKQHAEQHYMGRSHKKALESGGVKKQISAVVSDPTGRFTFGTGFLKSTDPLGLKVPQPEAKTNSNPFICELCNVSTTSKEQLDVHLGGSRHRKKLNTIIDSGEADIDKHKIPPPAAKGDTILETVVQRPKGAGRSENQDGTDEKKKDFSIFRTPSGQFYCATCNVTMNSENQFGQHNDSKRHKVNVANTKAKNSGTNNTGSSIGVITGGSALHTANVATAGTATASPAASGAMNPESQVTPELIEIG